MIRHERLLLTPPAETVKGLPGRGFGLFRLRDELEMSAGDTVVPAERVLVE
jgi:hypothetical protein